jgi:hypothetical protein
VPTRPPIHRPLGYREREERRSEKERSPYYGSRHWRELRDRVGKRDGWRCVAMIDGFRCGRPARTVHHIRARPRDAVEPTAFDVDENCGCLCDPCHGTEHRDKGQYDRMKD